MGIMVTTATGMFGFHCPPGHEARVSNLASRYTGQPATGLYSCCRWEHRYSGSSGKYLRWHEEIREIAETLTYRGPVYGLNLSKTLGVTAEGDATLKIRGTDSAYCEYRRNAEGAISIAYSLTSDTEHDRVVDAGTEIRRVSGGLTETVPYQSRVLTNYHSSAGGFTVAAGASGVFRFTV